MVLESGRAFGSYLDHESKALKNGLSTLIRGSRGVPRPFHHMGSFAEVLALNQGEDHQKAAMLTP